MLKNMCKHEPPKELEKKYEQRPEFEIDIEPMGIATHGF